ncbi:hypothetical protein F0U61_13195 [Archangium violaceum]|uniref:hypothetical protein n=1 Tax=Archangium violaceum TaxID=83451 RepID=UPI002B2EAEB3|nr:hypothetical protein F0U61_13195 [Archangium violaceum]
MAHTPEFDLDEMIGVLSSVIEKYAEDSKERAATKMAQAALLYTRDSRQEEDFIRYYKEFSNKSFAVEVSHEFATREDADKWLVGGKAEHAQRVKIAGKGFMVVQLPGRLTFMSAPLPEELETDERS